MARARIVTIDGPAGAGKTTVARKVAARLGFRFLDTGAMYRAATWKALREGIPLQNGPALAQMIRRTDLRMEGERIWVDGREVTRDIRRNEITRAVAPLANSPECREELGRLQRAFGAGGGLVTEGRDQGTAVFPDAEHKFYLDATVEERARRRAEELRGGGETAAEDSIRAEIERRDQSDRERAAGPLRCPERAIVLDTTTLSIDEVVERICGEVRRGAYRSQGPSGS